MRSSCELERELLPCQSSLTSSELVIEMHYVLGNRAVICGDNALARRDMTAHEVNANGGSDADLAVCNRGAG